jgi:hypothetical protein
MENEQKNREDSMLTMLNRNMEYLQEENSRLLSIIEIMSGAANKDIEVVNRIIGKTED